MGVMRLGFVEIEVSDLDAARYHYTKVLGMEVTAEQDDRIFCKAWDEWDHHSIVLRKGDAGLVKMGWKCSTPDDLQDLEKKAIDFGVTTERTSRGENVALGDGFSIVLPSGHRADFYCEAEYVGTKVGTLNPDPWPRGGVPGIGVSSLDHMLVTCDDVETIERLFTEFLGFRARERVVTDPADPTTLAVFLSANNFPHNIAFLKGPDAKLHHVAFSITDWGETLRAGDILSMESVPIDIGPTRHGITRGATIYFFDSSGNRNEVFSGGYKCFDDFPTITWTADQLGRGVFYIDRELNESFTSVLT